MTERIATRVAYGEALEKIGSDPRIIALDADLMACTRTDAFAEKYPNRHYNVGIAEANMVGIAAGLATCGKRPYVHSFAMFLAGRAFEQIRNSICYPNLPVVFAGTHAGLTVGKDGATHQCLEDLALMRVLPNMTVLVGADARETRKLTELSLQLEGPVYLRLSRYAGRDVTSVDSEVRVGGSTVLREGKDVTLFACGLMVERALDAAEALSGEDIDCSVIDLYSVKPIDKETIIREARRTGFLVTMEEHNIYGGLGSAVAEVLCDEAPAKLLRLGVKDIFGKSGNEEDLLEDYGLSVPRLVESVRSAWNKER